MDPIIYENTIHGIEKDRLIETGEETIGGLSNNLRNTLERELKEAFVKYNCPVTIKYILTIHGKR